MSRRPRSQKSTRGERRRDVVESGAGARRGKRSAEHRRAESEKTAAALIIPVSFHKSRLWKRRGVWKAYRCPVFAHRFWSGYQI